jgi:ABC-type glutathione transport system ATPase component
VETILSVSNLDITLPGGIHIVKGISFEIKSGEVVAIAGENGSGKSTILKAIMREDENGKKICGSISYCSGKNILEMSENELQSFRSEVAYVSQKDEYHNIGKKITVFDVLMDSADMYSAKKISRNDVSRLFDKYQLRVFDENTNKPLFYEKSRPAKLSGGQQRMLSIVASVAVREDAKLFIIDEPLNNLDFKNARKISNLITRIHKENPDAAILMVTHCRIFPAITRLITLRDGAIVSNEEEYHCYSCFGTPNQDGYYE